MAVNIAGWKEFRVGDIFTGYDSPQIERCKCNGSGRLLPGDDIKYLGAKKTSNGYMKTVAMEESLVTKGNCIVFICNGDGSVGYTNYMDEDFIGTVDLMVGYNEHLNKYTGTFLSTVLDLERGKYSFARKWGGFVEDTVILLPSKAGEPDWGYMESYMKSLSVDVTSIPDYFLNEGIDKAYWYLDKINQSEFEEHYAGNQGTKIDLKSRKWDYFKLGSIVNDIHNGKSYNASDLVVSDTDDYVAYVTRTDQNNGISMYVQNDDYDGKEKAGAITIGDTTATAFYQTVDFITGPHIVVIRADWFNVYTALFIISLLNLEKYRYPVFGRAFTKDLIQETTLYLPVDKSGNPDFMFMEEYIKGCAFSCNIA